jgi:hypothetical protein
MLHDFVGGQVGGVHNTSATVVLEVSPKTGNQQYSSGIPENIMYH